MATAKLNNAWTINMNRILFILVFFPSISYLHLQNSGKVAARSTSELIIQNSVTIVNYGQPVAEAEAEDGNLSGVTVSSSYSGYSGSGYVTGFDSDNDRVTVNIDVPETGFYRLVIRYNAPNGEKTQYLSVNNGGYSSLYFAPSDTFSIVDAGKYLLEKGINSFSIIKNWGWSNVDKFILYYAEPNSYNISNELVDSSAGIETTALYEFLKLQFGKRIISGQTSSYYEEIASLTGKSPMIRTGDFQAYTEGYPYLWKDGGHSFGKTDDGTVNELINWYNSTEGKGIVSFQWHWHSPTGGEAGTNTFYTDYTNFDITRAVTPGTPEYDDIIRDIDDISTELKKFRDAGIPVLWRPLHEAGGGWFWWGAKGPEACLELYDILFDRMKNHHNLNNLIWVWSTPEEDWYPGNEKVDIIGYDSYPGEYNYGIQKTMFDVLYRITGGKKLIAMTENGPIPDPEEAIAGDAPWLMFISWSNLVAEQNSEQHIKDVYNNPNVLTLESTNAISNNGWRSSLYPENWKAGYQDEYGRFLHDFSYAGYHKGEKELPNPITNITDITLPPYSADNTGITDVTSIIQQALDDVGSSGGGVVYLPAGTYRIKPAADKDYTLKIRYDSTILRGDGPDSTFILNDDTFMRHKDIILVNKQWSGWFNDHGSTALVSKDVLLPSRIIPVASVAGFNAGDEIIITNPATPEFIADHEMTGYWTRSAIKGVGFKRSIDSIDNEKNLLYIDTPTRYFLKTRDRARVSHSAPHLRECGIENLSIGNTQNPKSGWDEGSYSTSGTGAYDVHFSQAIKFEYSENCWVKNVHSYKPESNTQDIHILSNFLLLRSCRQITVDSCFFQKPQYEGGGGNGYMYTLESNDCMIQNSRANHSRHNYDFKYPFSNGNVIHNCRGENSKYSSDFHMYLSMSNLFDVFHVDGDYLESVFRPWGGSAIHGYSSTQSVFYNTRGENYHPQRDYIVESRQFGHGYIIGTSGPAFHTKTEPVTGTINGYSFDTSPKDLVEGEGEGEDLRPVSLYLDQYERRQELYPGVGVFDIEIELNDSQTGEMIEAAEVIIYGESEFTDQTGKILFQDVPSSFYLEIKHEGYINLPERQIVVYSDSSLRFNLERNDYEVIFNVYDENTSEAFWGVELILSGEKKITEGNGSASFIVPEGKHFYSASRISYAVYSDSLEIHSDTTINIYLERTHADIKFWLKEEGRPVNDATVKLNEDSLKTGNLGVASFTQQMVNQNYNFLVDKEGYKSYEGSIYLTTDTTLNIDMEKEIVQSKLPPGYRNFRFWPNPAHDKVNIQCNPVNNFNLRITDMNGREWIKLIDPPGELTIDISRLIPGVYVIQYFSGKKTDSFYLLIE